MAIVPSVSEPPAPPTLAHFASMRPELRPTCIDAQVRRAQPAQRAAWQRLGDMLTLLTTQRAIAARSTHLNTDDNDGDAARQQAPSC